MGWLERSWVEYWTARAKGLKPSETRYVRHVRSGTMDLRFSKYRDPGIEKNYRTHYVSPKLSERKRELRKEERSLFSEAVVFENHESQYWDY